MSRTPNTQEAEDLAQDIIVELIRSASVLRDDKAFYGFMWAVAGNVYKRWCKKKSRTNECALPENICEYPDETSDDLNMIDEMILLRRELSLLAEKYRKATVLYYIKGKTCSEISRDLSVSESMVKYLLFKSRKILKEGMNMERNLGQLSYNPKKLIPMYHGEGPNYFYELMIRMIPQNIVSACYNDQLTAEQISLETGIPLAYLEDEIRILEEKQLLLRSGRKYTANLILISAECTDQINRSASAHHAEIAEQIRRFVDRTIDEYRAIGFYGSAFSENSLKWSLSALVFRAIMNLEHISAETEEAAPVPPVTGWGERAWLWCEEKQAEYQDHAFNYSGMSSKQGDAVLFLDWLDHMHGDHHDLYGNNTAINILCDVARGNTTAFSEYDLETVAYLIQKGYVLRDKDQLRSTLPVYTGEQYEQANALVTRFVCDELRPFIAAIDESAKSILAEHTPKHLQAQISGIASMNKNVHAVSYPARVLVESGFLDTHWNTAEMPTDYIVLGEMS